MKLSDYTLLAAVGAIAVFVGAQTPAVRSLARGDTAAESPGAVTLGAAAALPARLASEPRLASRRAAAMPMVRDADVRRRLAQGSAGTYMDELLLDRDSALTRWPDRMRRPLRVWVAAGDAVPGWRPIFNDQVRAAFTQWTDAGVPLRFAFVRDSASADVHVTWVDRFGEPISGKTLWARDDRWWIVSADISLAVHHQDGDELDVPQIRAIALHEIGHLIGLDHTGDPANIMAPKVRVRELSPADQATARLLYSVPAGRVR
jgi:hypothetical protein